MHQCSIYIANSWLIFSGYFWQITDIHYDSLYNLNGDIYSMCHHTDVNDPPGPFGDNLCDSPWSLVMSAVGAMKKFNPNPDFILWTGCVNRTQHHTLFTSVTSSSDGIKISCKALSKQLFFSMIQLTS